MVDLGNKNVFRAVGQRTLADQGYETTQNISATFQAMEQSARARLAGQSNVALQHAHLGRVALLEGGALACVVLLLGSISTYWLVIENGKMEEKLNGFLESSPDAIVIVNKEGKIVVSNSHTERLLGYTPQELTGQTVAILVSERYRKVYLQQYAVFFANRGDQMTATSLELSAIHKDGREFPIEICMKPLETEQGILVTSAIRDISQRKQTEQQVSRLHEQLEQRAHGDRAHPDRQHLIAGEAIQRRPSRPVAACGGDQPHPARRAHPPQREPQRASTGRVHVRQVIQRDQHRT